ncbi:MAG: hypothetical protein ABI183_24455 [Polyangiaceae bacterium]
MDAGQRDDRETARARLVELQNELDDRRARVAELTRRVNLLPPLTKVKPLSRIPHSKIRVQIAAICGLLAGYGVSEIVGDARNGRAFGMATTVIVLVVVNWLVPWPLRFGKENARVQAPRERLEEVALESERRACERVEREISEVQHSLGRSVAQRSAE